MAKKLSEIAPVIQAAAIISATQLTVVPSTANLGAFAGAPSAKGVVDKAMEILREYYKRSDIGD